MRFADKTLTCRDCGLNFIFTVGEQEFYAAKQFEHEPSRCAECRAQYRNNRGASAGPGRPREMHEVVCAQCGVTTRVPFLPTTGRPVYCSDCFDKVRTR
jgi:CxxC-x17-CxxC domain-containing protein